ncbi:hypothetical protein [Bacillus alkalicellulosilyticus]|uniref:hypothetical protein n=1 Tax=Alkalihalobacterium alkalicellulosilyticum TaxID=1912214 RepID=UPI0009968D5E|nr:hypothetical protein [Bacillus alkalicellulosilyticus]
MIIFLFLGIFVTLISSYFLYIGWVHESVFLFGPFISLLVGLNFVLMVIVQYRRERRGESGV